MSSIILIILITLVHFFTAHAQNPKIYSINPSTIEVGATAFPLVIEGSNFAKSAQVRINGVDVETYFLSWNRIKATVTSDLLSNPSTLQVQVIQRSGRSNIKNLTVVSAPVGSYDWSALNAKLMSFVPSLVSGLTLQITRNGRTIYLRAFGDQTVDSVLPIASSTKMPSALAILTLVDEGRLNLDMPISQYLNGYVNVPPDKASITVRMLLNHTSGLQQSDCLNDQTSITLRECVQRILNSPLQFTPGSRFSYGGASFQVAGGVVEAITGQSWNEFFNRKIAIPLGLTRFTYTNTQNPRIAGGAYSDVGDYSKIMQAYLAGGVYGSTRVLSRQMYYEMQNDQKRDLPVVNSPGGEVLTGYSFGWWHTSLTYLQSQPRPQTPGPELSDQGAFGCTPWIDLHYNYTAILLIRDRTSSGTRIWEAIRPLIIEQILANSQSSNIHTKPLVKSD